MEESNKEQNKVQKNAASSFMYIKQTSWIVSVCSSLTFCETDEEFWSVTAIVLISLENLSENALTF